MLSAFLLMVDLICSESIPNIYNFLFNRSLIFSMNLDYFFYFAVSSYFLKIRLLIVSLMFWVNSLKFSLLLNGLTIISQAATALTLIFVRVVDATYFNIFNQLLNCSTFVNYCYYCSGLGIIVGSGGPIAIYLCFTPLMDAEIEELVLFNLWDRVSFWEPISCETTFGLII